MSTPYLGEIRLFAGSFAPANWSFCNGATLSIEENQALFALIGTTYGGDGQTTFRLPDLQGRVPIHRGGGASLGQTEGAETVTLTAGQMPVHTHSRIGSLNPAVSRSPSGQIPAVSTNPVYVEGTTQPTTGTLSSTGSGQPHENMQPFVGISFIIALFGIFPSQN